MGNNMNSQRKLRMLLLVILASCCCCSVFTTATAKTVHHDAEAASSVNDMRALIAFKRAITMDPLNTLADWNEDAPTTACNWTGITCSSKHPGRVVKIILQQAKLVGSISPHIANLSFLHVLDLCNNSLFGQIPSSLGKLHRLKVLDLCTNYLDGPIPPPLGNLSSLQFLSVCSNAVAGTIPASFSLLSNLQQLDVDTNLLTGKIPPFIGALTTLHVLSLRKNRFQGRIPADLGNLSSLEYLGLQTNTLNGLIPCSLAKLTHLDTLKISHSNVGGKFPLCLTNLTSLVVLDLDSNSLSGTIPFSLQQLCNLQELRLRENLLEGSIPRSLCNLSSLEMLDIGHNKLQGSLPGWIGSSFPELQILKLGYNNFSGFVPDSWANATELQMLSLADNSLSGTIPPCFGKLTKLSYLHLHHNYFISGISTARDSIPFLSALSNISELSFFEMEANLITGRLPLNIGNFWPKLSVLGLGENFISGVIPQSMGNFSSLGKLSLGSNMMDGLIPHQISNMQSIQYLDLSNNKLSGEIPAQISALNNTLTCLYLQDNGLSGSIPGSIGELVNLWKLSLGNNSLTGKIPPELGKCQNLASLVLSQNKLSGTIPPEVAGLRNIIFHFDLSRNLLSGLVPADIQGLQMGQYINLAANQLSGNIGVYMTSWLDAREVNLSFNDFSGSIPASIGNQMRLLRSMDLSHNSFTGSIPETFFNLSYLHCFNISHNRFGGEVVCSKLAQIGFSNISFMANPKLCGSCLGLPVCQFQPADHNSNSHRTHSILKIVLVVIVISASLLLLCTGILFYHRKDRFSRDELVWLRSPFFKLSAEELLRGTNNFSSANLVGEGSHGKVYRGVLSSGEIVAIKRFSCTDESRSDKNFRRECHVLAKIRHRNILRITTVVWSENLKVIVMPFMSNGNLHSLLHCRDGGTPLSLNLVTRLEILRQIAAGLSYLHHDGSSQVIHCDIKPENVLLDDDMTIKLSDFGIARMVGNHKAPSVAFPSVVNGSVGYIAPEYGIGHAASSKGDVYSFGIVILEVITRLKPTHEMFSGDLTLPKLASMPFEGTTDQQSRQRLKEIIKIVDANGGGIDTEKEEEMTAAMSMLLVGLRCTHENSGLRPTMKEVEWMLSSIKIGDPANHKTLLGSLEEALELVQSQKPLQTNTANLCISGSSTS